MEKITNVKDVTDPEVNNKCVEPAEDKDFKLKRSELDLWSNKLGLVVKLVLAGVTH